MKSVLEYKADDIIVEKITEAIKLMGAEAFARFLMDAANGEEYTVDIPEEKRVNIGLPVLREGLNGYTVTYCDITRNGRAVTFRTHDHGDAIDGKVLEVGAIIAAELSLSSHIALYTDGEGCIKNICYTSKPAYFSGILQPLALRIATPEEIDESGSPIKRHIEAPDTDGGLKRLVS